LSLVCLARLRFNQASRLPIQVEVALLERYISAEWQDKFDLLEGDFFDEQFIVIIYRLQSQQSKFLAPEAKAGVTNFSGTTSIATLSYNDLDFHLLQQEPSALVTREDILLQAIDGWKAGKVSCSIKLEASIKID
jgi:hypothetical protein